MAKRTKKPKAKRTKKPKEDPALTALGLVEMDETSDYVARGRAFKGREDAEVIDLWVAAFEKLFQRECDDIQGNVAALGSTRCGFR